MWWWQQSAVWGHVTRHKRMSWVASLSLSCPKTCELFCSVMLFLHCSVTRRLEAMFDLVARKRTQLCSTLIAWFIALTGQAQQRRVVLRQQSKAFVQVFSKWILSKTSADRSCRSGFRSVLFLSSSFSGEHQLSCAS